MQDEVDVGPCPSEESAVQIGRPDYHDAARAQCRAYVDAIRKVCGPEPDGARLKVTSNPHDFGSYLSVAVRYDADNDEAASYARKVDESCPRTWEEAGVPDPLAPAPPPGSRRDVGVRTADGCVVTVCDHQAGHAYPLNPRHDIRNHSPDGFNWSYSGSGPAQLALALCADALGDDERAQRVYQDFKFKVIGRIAGDEFELTADQVREAVAELEAARGRGR